MNRKPNASSGCNGVELIFMGVVFLNCDRGNSLKVDLLWVGKGAKALVGVEPGGIARYRVECGVRRARRVQ